MDKRKITILDGYTLNPGDLSWDGILSLGGCSIYDRTNLSDVFERCEGAEIVLTNKTIVNADVMERLPLLRYIGVMATGYNIVDVEAAKKSGIIVTNVPEYGTRSVAQAVFALLLELTNHVGHHSDTVKNGKWQASEDFCYWDYPLIGLEGLVFGIIGLGRIGRTVAYIAESFGMKVIAYDVNRNNLPANVRWAEIEQIFSASDIISLHCPLTSETKEIVNKDNINRMKKSAFLINTGRGPLVNESDLAEALNTGKIAGAALDVLSFEPPGEGNPLIGAKNSIITPHIAWANFTARRRLMETVVSNVESYLKGAPVNIVN